MFNCSSIIVYDNVRMLNEHNLQKGFRCNSFSISVFYYIGLTNPCDANSLATVTVRYISGIPIAHKSLESIKLDFETFKWVYTITPSIVYSIIIIIIILVLLCGKRVGGIYVTKHKD